MEYGAIDLHKKESQVRIVTEEGKTLDQRIATTRDRFSHVFVGRAPMRILIEAATESEWVAQHLEGMGHEVIVADPNYAPMYGGRNRRIKTDLRDVAALTEACQCGTYRLAHRRSAHQREVQSQLNVRADLVGARSGAISLARAITRAAGLRIRSGEADTFLRRLAELDLPASMNATLAPLRRLIDVLNEELVKADTHFEALVRDDPMVKRLTTLPGIGPITASAFVAALDVADRFERASEVTSYLGLVPQEYSSGERHRRGRLLRSAHPHVQSLLVQAALRISRSIDPRTATLRAWADGIARRRGKKIAMVALARRVARTLFAMWRDQTDFQPKAFRVRQPNPMPTMTSDTAAAHG